MRRGGAPQQKLRGAPRGRTQKPSWDEDTKAPRLFDSQLRHIFGARRERSAPRARPEVRSERPGQLRQRLQETLVRRTPEAPVERPVERPRPPTPPVVVRRPLEAPPVLSSLALPAAPEQLTVAHLRRQASDLSSRLAVLLPREASLVVPKRPTFMPETPEKVQKLSKRLSALLGAEKVEKVELKKLPVSGAGLLRRPGGMSTIENEASRWFNPMFQARSILKHTLWHPLQAKCGSSHQPGRPEPLKEPRSLRRTTWWTSSCTRS